jgi:integrase
VAAAGLGELEREIVDTVVDGRRRRRTHSRYRGPRPYDLRHAAASLLLRDPNYSLGEVAEFLGHDVATLSKHYAHVIADLKGQRPVPVEKAIAMARKRGTPQKRPNSERRAA